jgi:hypothetical protein
MPITHLARRSVAAIAGAAAAAGLLITAAPAGAAPGRPGGGGAVLPPSAAPYHITLTDMDRITALFQSSTLSTPIAPPQTPFQILADTQTTYTVSPGTILWVPVLFVDDTPTVLGCTGTLTVGQPGCVGIWPTTNRQAQSYLFDPAKVGVSGTSIVVDGRTTPIGPAYVAGPVATPPLLDPHPVGEPGRSMVVLAAYLSPLAPGSHTVSIAGSFSGAYTLALTGGSPVPFSETYTVVVRGCRR